ncbi:MAG: deoxyribonuclease IV, partial [Candidatus Lokiarchaeota archaeon]|nr:deoxyribonuclease IV [Candidatus Lokiarchaeota archaeon]
MSISGGKYKALERARDIGCESIQLFIRNARSWLSNPLEQDEISKFKKTREEISNIWPLLSHN